MRLEIVVTLNTGFYNVDYVELLWEGLYYSLAHPTTLIPYPRLTKIIVAHYMTEHPNISRRVHDNCHRVKNADLVKNIINSGKNKEGARIKIPKWMLTEGMKQIDHYQIIATQRSLEDFEAQQNVEQVKEHMVDEELLELLEGTENVDVDEFMDDILNSQEDLGNRIYPESYKESPEEKKSVDMITIHFDEVEKESAGDEKKFHQLAKHLHSTMQEFLPSMVGDRVNEITKMTVPLYVTEGLLLDKQKTQADVAAMITEDVQKERENLSVEITLQVNNAIANNLQYQLYLIMKDDGKLHNDDISIWWSLKIKFERTTARAVTPCKTATICPKDHNDHHDDGHSEGEHSAKRPKTSKHEIRYGTDDDEVPTKKVSQELMEEISEEIDEAQLKKAVDDMLRQRCNSEEENQYHVDQMQNYLKNDIVWESMKEGLSLPTPKKPAPVYHSCQRDLKAPPMTLQNQDLFYLKHGNSGIKKYAMSLHKYLEVPSPDDDSIERTSRWVSKCLKKFNVYARYGVRHSKNMWVKQFHIRMQKEKRDQFEKVYSYSKIVEATRTSYELGHKHKFITELTVRRANRKIDLIIEPDYKYLSKNDIEDLYLLCINGKVDNYRETGLLGSLTVFIRSTIIWERLHDFLLGIESHQQYVNLTAPTITFPGIKE
uniref:Uncharacterized protein n=1 Tax=Tanacetum cinerariifolium TaxID=118510 RepID=A0A6L2M846_TANCI|nr:hypothetical protein [Tanacetum cinerariifolium]